jgi:very-short-patch-repair endonuclease
MLQPFAVAAATLDAYRRYIRTGFPLRDEDLDSGRESLIEAGLLWQDAHVSLGRPGVTGPRLRELGHLLLPDAIGLPWGFEHLYAHQAQAIERLAASRADGPISTLVLSGTGSGKTESFLIPIVDACLRDPGPGVKALLIYPMNALANDQLKRLRQLLAGEPRVTFGRYTGDAPELDQGDDRHAPRPADAPSNMRWSRAAMRDLPPNILLTNYAQLEYLLLRGRDAVLFRHGPPIYLVVDEIHLFTGVLGAEVGCLLRRLRQHIGAAPGQICMVGTSATAGSEEATADLVVFAERFFGTAFGAGSAVAETPAPFRAPGSVTPLAPMLRDEDLAAAHRPEGLAALARLTFGLHLDAGPSFTTDLGAGIDHFRTVSVVEHALERPASIGQAAQALAGLPERAGLPQEQLEREATSILLLGAAAQLQPVGEGEPEPRFRPRVHQVVRSLGGIWRCLNPACGRLARPGQGQCKGCGSAILPLASCRSCGEAYWSCFTEADDLHQVWRLPALEPRRGGPAVFLTDPSRLATAVGESEDGQPITWQHVAVCPVCAVLTVNGGRLPHLRMCPSPWTPGIQLLASTDNVHCPSCGDQGARNRPILLPLMGSAAASVAVLTSTLSEELRAREGEAGGRLLVFADSRQDAAQQAGYADDQGARIAVRQLVTRAISERPASLPEVIRVVAAAVVDDRERLRRWLIGESERRFSEVAHPDYQPSHEDEQLIRHRLEWDVVLDVTERARRRFSLEQEGAVVTDVERLGELTAAIGASWADHPFDRADRLAEVVRAVADVMRYTRAVDHWMLKLTPRSLVRNHHVTMADRSVTATRGYAANRFVSDRARVDIRAWSSPSNATRMAELIMRVLDAPLAVANEVVKALATRLHTCGLLTQSQLEGRSRLMLDHRRLVLAHRDVQPLWRCDRCGLVRAAPLTSISDRPVCANWRCAGRPRPWEPRPELDFYRRQFLAPPRRLIVREHSGQVDGDERIAMEEAFNDRTRPSIDAFACTPTLEVGVSLDDLNGVVLRNLPPTPANYAQRVGRAGRRSRVALAVGHAGAGPHDTYFFERPGELIAGEVRAPAISLDNEPLLRRHVNSLVFETLGLDLPGWWVPPLDADRWEDPTVADSDGVLRESTLQPFAIRLADPQVRARVEAAVRGAFISPGDPAPPTEAGRVCLDQMQQFAAELRAALNRWCDRYRGLSDELVRLRTAARVPSQAQAALEDRLRSELNRLAEPRSPEYQPLGFLGLVGFLPRYGFTGTSVLLHPPQGETPIVQAGRVAVTEFAPGNLVYARGRKLKVYRLDPVPVPESAAGADHRDNVLREGRRCDTCEFLTFNPLERTCPHCGEDLLQQPVVELTGVWASGRAIGSEDDYRSHSDYEVLHSLGRAARETETVQLGGLVVERSSGREILVANRGLVRSDGSAPVGFMVCSGCGLADEAAPQATELEEGNGEGREHAATCPARRGQAQEVVRRSVWLSSQLRGDVMEIVLPAAARGKHFASWRATMPEALMLGIRELLQAGRRDLDAFQPRRAGEPYAIVLYDTMPGGTGYFPKLFANGAEGLKAAAALALARLEACDCVASCHRCLRDFWNQRLHQLLNRFEAMTVLRRLAGGPVLASPEAENERLESFLEQEFFDRLRDAGLPAPTLQVYREIGGRRVTRADALYADPDVTIFLDGREFHARSREKIAEDLERRNGLEARGETVLEFTFEDVLQRFPDVADAIRHALKRMHPGGPAPDPRQVRGLEVTAVDQPTRSIRALVDADAWITDERARAASLASANRLRLFGWRLNRTLRPSP